MNLKETLDKKGRHVPTFRPTASEYKIFD